jgi:hypothetical protein
MQGSRINRGNGDVGAKVIKESSSEREVFLCINFFHKIFYKKIGQHKKKIL